MDKIWKKGRIVIFSLLCILYTFSISRITYGQERQYVTLRAGTPVMVEVLDTIDSGRYQMGATVPLAVIKPVVIDDYTVILYGTEVYGKVTEVQKAKGWGKKGDITILIESSFAVDGQEVLMSATQYAVGSSKGGGAAAVAVGTGLLCLPLAFTGAAVKGEEGTVPVGMTIKAHVDMDYKIEVISEDAINQKQKEITKNYKEKKKELEKLRKESEKEEQVKKPEKE